ncbi:MAG TPA: hypothetical protein PLO61_05740 [Fimbriimonadaceae bacterium]|nr:hypothetical protein [Fimbriimonadaceae bacterium]HRJ33380.1 hypothetical protein [Fimbriimonadaceae bacterium]
MPNPRPQTIVVPIIAGVPLELYAELAARMHAVLPDEDACLVIASEAGLTAEQWAEAQEGWNEALRDPLLGGALSALYLKAYRAALEELEAHAAQ